MWHSDSYFFILKGKVKVFTPTNVIQSFKNKMLLKDYIN